MNDNLNRDNKNRGYESNRNSRQRRKNRKTIGKRKRGVPVGLTVAIAAICSAAAFSGAYIYAMNTFNSKVTDLAEKQAMFTKLYEIDSAVRENYGGTINEDELNEAISSTYVKNIDRDNIIYIPENKYNADKFSNDYKSFKISDGSYVLIKKSALKNKTEDNTSSSKNNAAENTTAENNPN